MQQTHGKKFNLKHITVKVPNKIILVARATTTPPSETGGAITIDQTDSLLNDSDHSPSQSPTPPTPIETSLEFFPTAPLSPVGADRDRGILVSALDEQGQHGNNHLSHEWQRTFLFWTTTEFRVGSKWAGPQSEQLDGSGSAEDEKYWHEFC